MLTIRPLIHTLHGTLEVLGFCSLHQTYTVRSLDGKHVSHITADEVVE